MPFRRCRHFDQVTGKPLGAGCPARHNCAFVHPEDTSSWREARPSKPHKAHHFSPRDRSPSVASSAGSSRNFSRSRMPRSSSRYDPYDHRRQSPRDSKEYRDPPRELLSNRLSDPNSLGSRLRPSSPPLPPSEPLSMRLRDPAQSPPPLLPPVSSDSLSKRISPPSPPPPPPSSSSSSSSSWAGPSGWGSTTTPVSSWSVPAAFVPQVPPSPSANRKRSLSPTAEASNHPIKHRTPSIPLPAFDKQPLSRPVLEQPISIPPPPSQTPALPAPPQPVALVPVVIPTPTSTSIVQETSATPTPTLTTLVPSPAQEQYSEILPVVDQQPTQVPEARRPSMMMSTKSIKAQELMRDLCENVELYADYRRAEQVLQNIRNQQLTFRSSINDAAQSMLENNVQEADLQRSEKYTKWEDSLSKFLRSWPAVAHKNARYEELKQQVQVLKQAVQSLEDSLKAENNFHVNSLTVQEVVTRQVEIIERLDRADEYQEDAENHVQHRLDDLAQRHKQSYEDLYSRALSETTVSTAHANQFQDQLAQLAQRHDAFADQISQMCRLQADILKRSQELQKENEQLKSQLAMYEERDARLNSELKAAVQSLDILSQQASNMQNRTDQLTESMKEMIVAQTRERIEERFSVARQEMDSHFKTTREGFNVEFKLNYGPTIDVLEQFSNHLRSTTNGPNHAA